MSAISLASPRRSTLFQATGAVLGATLLGLVAVFGCWVAGTRGLEVGTDTSVYAYFFEQLAVGSAETRMEPGFVLLSWLLAKAGLGVTGYQAGLFATMLLCVAVAMREMQIHLGANRGYLTLLGTAIMLLYVSPMFVNATINAIRQGLAAPLAFAALLAFQNRRWMSFVLCGLVASSLHYSSLLFLVLAPALWMRERNLRLIGALAFTVYCIGLSLTAVRGLLPQAYNLVMTYAENPYYRIGVRLDFAAFAIVWYVMPLLLAPMVREEVREPLKRCASIYLIMALPFLAVGWGPYSNRFLLPAFLSASMILAAALCHSRLTVLRNPLLLRVGLAGSCLVFAYLVANMIVI